uniref:Uncharacterized protein n=1 Tax=Anguilla anguilla TaxID=7936 RepID=A0A0E9WWA1_ANGAN
MRENCTFRKGLSCFFSVRHAVGHAPLSPPRGVIMKRSRGVFQETKNNKWPSVIHSNCMQENPSHFNAAVERT